MGLFFQEGEVDDWEFLACESGAERAINYPFEMLKLIYSNKKKEYVLKSDLCGRQRKPLSSSLNQKI